jgi:ABC-2 type transport system ATP-binding protein
MIRIEGLVKQYGAVRALDGLTLTVEPGSIYGFLGPNGAGKTTTMRILSGLARQDSGRAWILDCEVGSAGSDVRKLIGVLPEEPTFYPWMRANEYLSTFVAPLYGIEGKDARRRTAELLELVGLREAAKRKLAGFSRGMRQRMGLAQALLHQPKVLLLDEPVSALDPAGRREVLNLFECLRGQTTVLLSTHILNGVERVCDKVGIIDHGKMVIQSQRDELLERYAIPIIEVEGTGNLHEWLDEARQYSFVERVDQANSTVRLYVKDVHRAEQVLLPSLMKSGLFIHRFEVVHPSLEEVFLRLTEKPESKIESEGREHAENTSG